MLIKLTRIFIQFSWKKFDCFILWIFVLKFCVWFSGTVPMWHIPREFCCAQTNGAVTEKNAACEFVSRISLLPLLQNSIESTAHTHSTSKRVCVYLFRLRSHSLWPREKMLHANVLAVYRFCLSSLKKTQTDLLHMKSHANVYSSLLRVSAALNTQTNITNTTNSTSKCLCICFRLLIFAARIRTRHCDYREI